MGFREWLTKRKAVKRRRSAGKTDIHKTSAATAFDANDFHQKENMTGSAGNIDRNRNWQQGKSSSQY